jgi:hypothetical protein
MNKQFIENNYKQALVALFVIVGLTIVYNSYVVIPNKKIDIEVKREQNARAEYDTCMEKSYKDYTYNWDINCEALGKSKTCDHSGLLADSLNQDLAKGNEQCLRIFEASK